MKQETSLEERAYQSLNGFRTWVDSHSRLIFGFIGGTLVLSWADIISIGLPSWAPVGALVLCSAGIAGYFAGGKVTELIPSPEGIYLIAFRADSIGGEAVWELSEDEFSDLEVDGTLYSWDESPKRVYECRDYDPEQNRAVANWRESEPGTELAAGATPSDAMAAIRDVRQTLEPSAAEARELRRRIRGIVRTLDEQRTRARARQMDSKTLDEGIEAETISEIIEKELPEDLHPQYEDQDNDRKKDSELNIDEPEAVLETNDPGFGGLEL